MRSWWLNGEPQYRDLLLGNLRSKSFFIASVFVCLLTTGAFADNPLDITIAVPTLNGAGNEFDFTGTVGNPPPQDAVCWILEGPDGTGTSVIVEQLNGGNAIDAEWGHKPGFANGTYTICLRKMRDGRHNRYRVPNIGVFNGQITFVTAQFDPDP